MGFFKKIKNVKVGAVSPRIRLCDVAANALACVREAVRAAELGVRVLVFPELTLTGATCGDLFCQPPLCERAERGLAEFIEATRELDMMSFIGVPAEIDCSRYNCTAVVYRGELLGLAVRDPLYEDEERYFDEYFGKSRKINFAGQKTKLYKGMVFAAPFDKDIDISVGTIIGLKKTPSITVVSSYSDTIIGSDSRSRLLFSAITENTYTAYIHAEAGIGESTTDAVYAAHNIIAHRGKIIAEAVPFAEDNLVVADVRVNDKSVEYDLPTEDYSDAESKKNPFLPESPEGQRKACLEAFEIQAQGLAARLERSYSKSMVIGVSGGLDSTLALLVCARAADILGMDRKSVIGVTMPCFGTTKRTRSNAEKLCEDLGISFRTVDIKASVTQHLSDIGHDGVTTDVTYENAQARERTQVIMDIANMTGGLVVGTGDLSELVLGWATYNGDHMSMYGVNASVPKTMVRRIVEVYSRDVGGEVSAILDDILATPVSPELLPPKDGEIAQCTEALVGPYELHDFFIYYVLGCGYSPRETYEIACETFADTYDNKTVLGWLRVFMRRFISQQFKRSCLPDGPRVSYISVSPRCGLSMPSDASAAVWLSELDELEKEEK